MLAFLSLRADLLVIPDWFFITQCHRHSRVTPREADGFILITQIQETQSQHGYSVSSVPSKAWLLSPDVWWGALWTSKRWDGMKDPSTIRTPPFKGAMSLWCVCWGDSPSTATQDWVTLHSASHCDVASDQLPKPTRINLRLEPPKFTPCMKPLTKIFVILVSVCMPCMNICMDVHMCTYV